MPSEKHKAQGEVYSVVLILSLQIVMIVIALRLWLVFISIPSSLLCNLWYAGSMYIMLIKLGIEYNAVLWLVLDLYLFTKAIGFTNKGNNL